MSKGPNAFRTISEAAEEVGVPQHVLRFWETKFSFIAPMKRAGGRRFYRPADVAALKGVRRLLHEQGLTIKGVQRLHRTQGLKAVVDHGDPGAVLTPAGDSEQGGASAPDTSAAGRMRRLLADLEAARSRLEQALAR